ncbi:MAG: 3-deoxy-D-manno-octulosonic acid transferase [Verrucomicrobiae bacterium]|nr:3-deoxy-D-manno-octulosonic acid transferase [Verrucomicrobiae bacterium]
MRWVYTVIYAVGFVLLSPWFLYVMWRRGKYRENFGQRFGRYGAGVRARLAQKRGPRLWVQAVSVGEVNVALCFLRSWRAVCPQWEVVLSTTTSTGYALARERVPAGVEVVYFPQDFPWVVRGVFDLVQPDGLVLVESELWPNVIWEAAGRGVPVCLVNARLSPRSARRYRAWRGVVGPVVSRLALVCAQTEREAALFRELGVEADRVQVTGNIKFDAALPAAGAEAPFDVASALREAGLPVGQPVLVAGSTHAGEEKILFDLLRAIPGLVLVLVPRHVERTGEIVELARREGVPVVLRRGGERPSTTPRCLLVNTTGELRWFYTVATVIFVGKSLVGRGGQNIVEAAASGRPVVFGPHVENFAAIAAEFVSAGAAWQVRDARELRVAVETLLREPERGARMAEAARQVIARNAGAAERTARLVASACAAGRAKAGAVEAPVAMGS